MEDFRFPLSVATCSVGYGTTHSLARKLESISRAGFDGIELAFPDLVAYASERARRDVRPSDPSHETFLLEAAQDVNDMCRSLGLVIMMLQPFTNFEGWPDGSEERQDAFKRARLWIKVMKEVGTNILQVGSSDSPNITGDKQRLADDLGELADLLAPHGFLLAYENWCWATHAPTWSQAWEIVDMANRPNVGLCLDTFQTAGGEWGDPTTASGLREDAPAEEVQRKYEASLRNLAARVPKDKIYVLQISDAYQMRSPMSADVDGVGTWPRGRWSHAFRPTPYDGGYLPIEPMVAAVLETGFRGWFSLEVFDGGRSGEGKQNDMDSFAAKGIGSLRRLIMDASGS